jgi:hypothetical protein
MTSEAEMTPDLRRQLIDTLYSVPPADRHRAYWVMSREWRDKLAKYAETVLHERPPALPSELLGRPFIVDDAHGFPALVIPDD